MGEPVLYFRKGNVLIKFDGGYWYWSSKDRVWIPGETMVTGNYSIRDLTYLSEKEAQKYCRNYP